MFGRCRVSSPPAGLPLWSTLPRTEMVPPEAGKHAGDEIERRALAGAVRADQSDDLACPHVEGDVIDRDHAAKLLARVIDPEPHVGVRADLFPRRQHQRWIGRLAIRFYRQNAGPAMAIRRSAQAEAAAPASCRTRSFRAGLRRETDRANSSCKDFLQDDDDRSAQYAAPDITGAADHRDEKIFDAGLRRRTGSDSPRAGNAHRASRTVRRARRHK